MTFDYKTLGMMATLDFTLGMRPVLKCNRFSVDSSTVLFCWTAHQFFAAGDELPMTTYSIEEAVNSNNSFSPKGSRSRLVVCD